MAAGGSRKSKVHAHEEVHFEEGWLSDLLAEILTELSGRPAQARPRLTGDRSTKVKADWLRHKSA